MNQYNEQTPTQTINTFTLQDLVDMVLRKWYWFVLSIGLFGGYAWYQYAKTPVSYTHLTLPTILLV